MNDRTLCILMSVLIILVLPTVFVLAQSPNVGLLRVVSENYPRQVPPSSDFTVTVDVEYAVRTNATIRAAVVSGQLNASGQVLWQSQVEIVLGGGDKVWTFNLTAPSTEGTNMQFTFIVYFFDNGAWHYFNDTQSGLGYVQSNLKIANMANLTIDLEYGNIPVSVNNSTENTSPDGSFSLTRPVGKTYWIAVPSVVQLNGSTRLTFSAWGDGSNATRRSFLLDGDTNLGVTYNVQYLVQVNSAISVYSSSEWYVKGSNVSLHVESQAPMSWPLGALGMKYNFEGWSGDVNSKNEQLNITVNGPMTVTANFVGDYSSLTILIIPTIGAVGGILLLILRKKTRREAAAKQGTPEPSTRVCSNCKETVEEGWEYCIHCGSKLGSSETVKNGQSHVADLGDEVVSRDDQNCN